MSHRDASLVPTELCPWPRRRIPSPGRGHQKSNLQNIELLKINITETWHYISHPSALQVVQT